MMDWIFLVCQKLVSKGNRLIPFKIIKVNLKNIYMYNFFIK